jgi:adenylate kinase family enzyme
MLILVRGLPGSGKTTCARFLSQGSFGIKVFEADDYFTSPAGYHFDAKHLPDAHASCIDRTSTEIARCGHAIVANTFSTIAEMQPYIDLADEYSRELIVYKMTGKYGSIHNVPAHTIERMSERWENYPGEICI